MRERTYTIDDIEILFVKSKKAKGVNITIRPFKGVRVAVPYYVTFKAAVRIVNNRMSWVYKNLNKIQVAENKQTVFDSNSKFKTRQHSLSIIQNASVAIGYKITNNEIIVFVPETINVQSELVQLEIRKAIECAWRKEAKETLPIRVAALAEAYGFSLQKVTIKNTKTRWGSCSYKNNINLCLHLMRLPDYLVDYVILHELVHTKVKNHSQQFWAMLHEISPMSKEYDKELKNHRIGIY
ncbi:MAG: SprT family zinc-dependent metalloprotease [Flavobacteriales bacterium]|nr:SprT family zinc-dependent metalloprotease [Flavobacteriales bacterium]